MIVDFPNSPPPQSGDRYVGPNGVEYFFDGVKWIGSGVASGAYHGIPNQTGNAGKFLYTDGYNPVWRTISTATNNQQDWISTTTTWTITDYTGHAEFTSETPSPGTRWLDFNDANINKTNLVGGNIDFHTYIHGDPTNHATVIGSVYFSRLDTDWTTDVTEIVSGVSDLTYDTRNNEGVYIMINTSTTATIYGKIHYSGKLFYSPDGSTQ
jgi:hypothetical protein